MPFRLTRQFINLMLPLKETGLVCSVMVCALRALRARPDLLITTMDVFVKEPSFDWRVRLFLHTFHLYYSTPRLSRHLPLSDGSVSYRIYQNSFVVMYSIFFSLK